jgi:hypothetical protein
MLLNQNYSHIKSILKYIKMNHQSPIFPLLTERKLDPRIAEQEQLTSIDIIKRRPLRHRKSLSNLLKDKSI